MGDKYAVFGEDNILKERLIRGIHAIPMEAVEIDDELWFRLIQETECVWVLDAEGKITKGPMPAPPPLTAEENERLRLAAYANPLTGSDRYFSEALRMQVMGEEGWEEVRAAGVTRYKAIQAQFPWTPPDVDEPQ
ncbi:hypothetical protein AB7M22_001054 [Pseudomonas sp. ADAK2 TE3594]